jgi:hypothetical protein
VTRDDSISRRTLLAAASGVVGVAGMGTLAEARKVTFTQSRQIEIQQTATETDARLEVDWTEWYNGEVVGERTSPADAPGQIQIPDVKPGDSGRLTLGLSTAAAEGTPPAAEITMRVLATERRENGRNEPERKAGDTTPNVGELQEFIDVELWYDTGVRMEGMPLYGTCDGENNMGDTELATGSLGEVAGEYTLDVDASNPLGLGSCLEPDETICLTLDWQLDPDMGNINVIQGDSVEFAVAFEPRECEQ